VPGIVHQHTAPWSVNDGGRGQLISISSAHMLPAAAHPHVSFRRRAARSFASGCLQLKHLCRHTTTSRLAEDCKITSQLAHDFLSPTFIQHAFPLKHHTAALLYYAQSLLYQQNWWQAYHLACHVLASGDLSELAKSCWLRVQAEVSKNLGGYKVRPVSRMQAPDISVKSIVLLCHSLAAACHPPLKASRPLCTGYHSCLTAGLPASGQWPRWPVSSTHRLAPMGMLLLLTAMHAPCLLCRQRLIFTTRPTLPRTMCPGA
jgi:hypothetical protein